MSFNKRYINTNTVIHAYNTNGLGGVERLMFSDALIIEGKDEEEINKIFAQIRLHNPNVARDLLDALVSK